MDEGLKNEMLINWLKLFDGSMGTLDKIKTFSSNSTFFSEFLVLIFHRQRRAQQLLLNKKWLIFK